MKKIGENNKFKLAFIVLLLIQILYMLYWGQTKSGFYVDEFFTYDNAHYMSASTPKRVKLYEADYMKYNEWFDLMEIKSTLTVSKENSLLNDGIIYNIKALLKKPYMTLLNYTETLFFTNELNKWSGISINILFFVISQVFFYLLAKRVIKDDMFALLATAMFGFSGIAVSMVAFVRFYMLVNMWMIIFLYLHVLMWEETEFKKNILYEILAVLALFMGFKNSPLAMIEGAAVIFIFSVMLLVKKRKKQMLFYTMPICVCGLLYIIFFTYYLEILFNVQDVVNGKTGIGIAAVSLVRNVISLTPEKFVSRSLRLVNFINDYLFAHIFVTITFFICVISAIVRKIFAKEKMNTDRSYAYTILFGTAVIYFIASVCLSLGEIRYNSFLYPIITLVIITLASDSIRTKRSRVTVFLILALAICGQLYFTVKIPRVQNSYPDDLPAVQAVNGIKGIDNVVIDYEADDRVMYECLAYGDDSTKIMFMRIDECDFSDMPDKVLVWQSVNWSDEVSEKLKSDGYKTVEQIGMTHESIIFLCSR